ncbi:MAG: hypothetical protein F6K18_23900 [Okeania sp. SIO2C2]|uniref:hypothetical protein n=1 Tax=Okeania sp. SIO2C2 TaxID=2607787 RepID=UPI0013B86D0C|nr:hypothetical protein [Okeania sp. SIO2C2]NEP89629.1 hypothetical protein [Okeania sp. SIO2C2]
MTEKLWSIISHFKGIKKAVERWRGLLAISNRPREENILDLKPLVEARGTESCSSDYRRLTDN